MTRSSAVWASMCVLALTLELGLAAIVPSFAGTQGDGAERVFAEQLSASHVPGGAISVVTSSGIDAAGVGTAGDAGATRDGPRSLGGALAVGEVESLRPTQDQPSPMSHPARSRSRRR